MHSRHFLTAFSLLALSALAAPARAESPFATKRYEITFSDGWQPMPSLAGNDSTLTLMYGYSMMGYCFLSAGMEAEGGPAASAQLDAFRNSFAGSDSASKSAEGSATLGGRAFAMVEYASADSSAPDTRFRYYSMTEGPLSFTAALIYDGNAGSVLVPDFETALGTLGFPTVPVRAWAAPSAPVRSRIGHDILGRSLPGALRTAAFYRPAR
jgi:hypothetical protein